MQQLIKDARIEFKTTKEVKELLQDVAHSLGMDLSNFILSTVTQKAKEVIKEEKILTLTNSEWKKFEEYLNSDKEATKELKDLMNLESFDE